MKLLFLSCSFWVITTYRVLSQSITAAPDGTGTVIHHNGNTYKIDGGTQAEANLFHSFQEFGLNPQEIANFLSNPNISNILGRVTGGNPSIIQGMLKMSGGNSNLFLMNPAGWVFSQGASLDLSGSFAATTATRIGIDGGYFNAYGNNNYSQLTGNPTSLIFDQENPSWIANEANLAVNPGESLWLVGGGIISTGTVEAEEGNITLAAIPGKKQIELSHDGLIVDLVLNAAPAEGSVTIPASVAGIKVADIPRYLSGGSEIGHADSIHIDENGNIVLGDSQEIEEGDTVITGTVKAEDVTFMAAGRAIATTPELISGNTTVVRFPEAGGTNILNVIDSRADNAEDLLYGAEAGTISSIIEREEGGIAAITGKLAEIDRELDGIAITAEGHEGNFWLGEDWVTDENVNNYAGQLATWAKSLKDGADILLYSCFAALGEAGEGLIGDIANLTGADVAASTNATGSENYGGDWGLEYATGSIEVGTPFTRETLGSWDGKLATLTVTSLNDAGAGTLRNQIAGAGAGDTINFGISGTILLNSAISWGTDNLTIDGNGQSNTIIDGQGQSRIFNISASNVTISNLTIQNGSAYYAGGGINTTGSITLTNSKVSNSSISGFGSNGGGLYASGSVTLTNSTVSGNRVQKGSGGGLYAYGSVTLTNSTVNGNSVSGVGGGVIFNWKYHINKQYSEWQ